MSCPCPLHSSIIKPIIHESVTTLLLIDFPSPQDKTILFESLDSRTQTMFKALSLAKINQDEVCIAPAIRCQTKSKDIKSSLVANCIDDLINQLPQSVDRILCFGVYVFSILTGLPIKNIDEYRKNYTTIEKSGKKYTVGCTYSITMVSSGCSKCNQTSYSLLTAKDINRIMGYKTIIA